MLTNTSTVTRRRRNSVLFFVIAALFVVPPIVRATATIKSSSPIRLNRGFETPPSKGDVVTSLEQATTPASTLPAGTAARRASAGLARQHPHVVAPSDRSPDPQRGPPSITFR